MPPLQAKSNKKESKQFLGCRIVKILSWSIDNSYNKSCTWLFACKFFILLDLTVDWAILFIDIGKHSGPLIPRILMGVTGSNGGASSSVAAVGSYPNDLRISITSSFVYIS